MIIAVIVNKAYAVIAKRELLPVSPVQLKAYYSASWHCFV